MADVQQVTTRSNAKTVEWEEQDGIRKAAQEWVTKANAANIERMRHESTSDTPEIRSPVETDPIWDQALQFGASVSASDGSTAAGTAQNYPDLVYGNQPRAYNHRPPKSSHQSPGTQYRNTRMHD